MSPPLIIMAEMRYSPSHISVLLHTIGEEEDGVADVDVGGAGDVTGRGVTSSGSRDTLCVNVYCEDEGSLL